MANLLPPTRGLSGGIRRYAGQARSLYELAAAQLGNFGALAYTRARGWLSNIMATGGIRVNAWQEAGTLLSYENLARKAGADLMSELQGGPAVANIPTSSHLAAGEVYINAYFYAPNEAGDMQPRWLTISRFHVPTWNELIEERDEILELIRKGSPVPGMSDDNDAFTLIIHRAEHGSRLG